MQELTREVVDIIRRLDLPELFAGPREAFESAMPHLILYLVAECERMESQQDELAAMKEEIVEYVLDGAEFNWPEAVVAIRDWRQRAEENSP
jgi:hypothetical protein